MSQKRGDRARLDAILLLALLLALSGCLPHSSAPYPHTSSAPALGKLPCGGNLLFAKDGRIWQLRGGSTTPLLATADHLTQPVWSADQSRLYYSLEGPSFSDIWSAGAGDPAGSGQALTKDWDRYDVTYDRFAYYPAPSPDGVRLAFASSRDVRYLQGSDLNLWILNLQTGDTAEVVYGIDYTGGIADVQWRPNPAGSSDQISYTNYSYDVEGKSHSQVMLYDRATGTSSPLTQGLEARQAAWAPDGSQIAFTVRSGSQEQLMVAPVPLSGQPAVGPTQANLVASAPGLTQPDWCPNGGWVAYLSLAGGSFDLWAAPLRPQAAPATPTSSPPSTPGSPPAAPALTLAGPPLQLTAGAYLDARARPSWGAH